MTRSPALGALPAYDIDPVRLSTLLRPAESSLPVPSAADRAAWSLEGGRIDAATARQIAARAEGDLGRPWPQPLASDYANYFRDGTRVTYEQQVFDRQERLSRATLVAGMTLDPRWIDEVADGIVLLCEQSSWCWPAHDDTFARHGRVVPTVDDPFLDLGAGEVAAQLAWCDHVLGESLEHRYPGLRERIRLEVGGRVLEPFLRRRDWHWLGLDGDIHNWNPWIHGNVLVAALRLAPAADRAVLVSSVVDGLHRYVASLPADGAIDEGYGYWWNGACRAIEALDLLRHATDGAVDPTAVDALRATVAFPHAMHLGGEWYLNFADSSARPSDDQPWAALFRAGRLMADQSAVRHAAAHRGPGAPVATERQGLGRLLNALFDEEWQQAVPGPSPLPRDVDLPSIQVLLAREQGGSSDGLALAVKGGHNGEHHNHNDVGGLVVALDGVPVLVDAGRPTYTRQTFSPERYRIWTMQSSWHNVPEIRGTAQSPGHAFAARSVSTDIGPSHSSMRLDLAAAYDRSDVRHWWRTARLDRTGPRVTVVDEWELCPLDGAHMESTVVHLLLAGEVRIADDHVVVAPVQGQRRAALRWSPSTLRPEATTMTLDDPILSSVWGPALTRLTLDVGSAPAGSLTLTLEVDE